MANVVGSVTAQLLIDTSGFNQGITTAMKQVKEIETAFKSTGGGMSSKNFSAVLGELEKIRTTVSEIKEKMGEVGSTTNKVKESASAMVSPFKEVGEIARKGVADLKRFQEQVSLVNAGLGKLNATSGLAGLSPTLNTSTIQMNNLASATKNTTSSITGFNSSATTQISELEKLGVTYNATGGKATQFGNSVQSSNTRLKENWNQLYRVTSALHSLKVVLTTVSSMFIWTFGMSLFEATKQTLSSKNEMESYLVQMGKTEGEIRSFNQGLDETVDRFKKLNKFMIGETIAGIGMEFDLSTDEMKEAMEVVAMIQNEYVRAGRKESEASLAVKDILQGEFLRLSRETGVGKQDLIDTGKWSGDLKDIVGLMEALKEVGEARHWDQFASKCRSLSDVISMTKNRISEFTATLIDDLSPAIVTVFNMVTGTIDGLTDSFNNMGLFEKVLGGVTIFYALSSALIVVAGNVNLLDLAMYGYRNSLMATIFQVEVATVSEHGLKTAIVSKITAINADTVATIGNWKALATRLLGLDASIVKEYGLRTAIATAVAMKKLDTASTTENTLATTVNNTTVGVSSGLYTVNTTETQANTVAKKVNSTANLGVLKTLVVMVTGLEAETVATMGATEATIAFITSLTVLETLTVVGVLALLAGAFVGLASEVSKTADTMKNFNDITANHEEVIQTYQDSVDRWKEREQALQEKLANTEKGTAEYTRTLQELNEASLNSARAQENLASAVESVNRALAMQDWVANKKQDILTEQTEAIAQQMESYNYSPESIDKLTNQLKDLDAGTENLYHAMQVYSKQSENYVEANEELMKVLGETELDETERTNYLNDLADAYDDLMVHSFVANTSDNWGEIIWNKMLAGLDQMRIDWIKWWADFWVEGNPMSILDGVMDRVTSTFGQFTLTGLIAKMIGGDTEAGFNFSSIIPFNIGVSIGESLSGGMKEGVIHSLSSLSLISLLIDMFSNSASSSEVTSSATQSGIECGTAWWEGLKTAMPILRLVDWVSGLFNGVDTSSADNKGEELGNAMYMGIKGGVGNSDKVVDAEMEEIKATLDSHVGGIYSHAQNIGSSILNGINSIIQHHSPGIPARLVDAEMGEIELAMQNHVNSIRASAESVGEAITGGIQPDTTVNIDGNALSQYQQDTRLALGLAGNTVSTTESAFNELDMQTALTFGNIGNTIGTTMSNIASNTKSNYNTLALTTKSQLSNMQSETTKNINQIKDSWNGMQTALIQSAENIRNETGSKIRSLESNMGQFWRKVQNPALLLGAGSPSEERKGARPRRFGNGVGRVLRGGFAGASNLSTGAKATGIPNKINSSNMSIKMLDALDLIYEAMLSGKPAFFGGWNFNWSKDIQNALLNWKTNFGSIYDPYLSVGKFENNNFPVKGIPEIARNYIYDAISRTSYEFYYNSKYGSPLATWNAGHFNCYDGALLVLALAEKFGFSGHMVHGSWNGIPHVWAYINGIGNIDSTAIQGGYGLTAPSRTGVSNTAWRSAGGIDRFKHNKSPSEQKGNTINGDVHIHIDGTNLDSEEVGNKVKGVILDLFSPNPSTGH